MIQDPLLCLQGSLSDRILLRVLKALPDNLRVALHKCNSRDEDHRLRVKVTRPQVVEGMVALHLRKDMVLVLVVLGWECLDPVCLLQVCLRVCLKACLNHLKDIPDLGEVRLCLPRLSHFSLGGGFEVLS